MAGCLRANNIPDDESPKYKAHHGDQGPLHIAKPLFILANHALLLHHQGVTIIYLNVLELNDQLKITHAQGEPRNQINKGG